MASDAGASAARTSNPQATSEAVVILVLGATGAGKSHFIRAATENPSVGVGHSIQSETAKIAAYKTEIDGNSVILVDTIGFDDTIRSDAAVLRDIATWLAETYAEGFSMAGILYIHDITTARFTGSAGKNLRMFEKMVGAHDLNSTTFVVNKSNGVPYKQGEARLRELVEPPEFWGAAIETGAMVTSFRGTAQDAQEILKHVESFSMQTSEKQRLGHWIDLRRDSENTLDKDLSKEGYR
ncbi:hypothetical protein IL306_008989 [Fusarium sp. DS 682]|nr:hypothetical protein IL306_008989 [Fusarium sp. DS 682]